jgi:NAD(P)-dependent dehydrogenase (short-subunit alcohol dehydrogenase family)
LLTNLLINKLKNSPNARVVTVASMVHIAGEIHFEDINLDKKYNKYEAYFQSKLANVLFTRELSKRLSHTNIKAYCLHPGLVRTELTRHWGGFLGFITSLVDKIFSIDPASGAQTSLYCALEPSISEESGHYYK